jgi:hypothetical protein
MTEYTKPTTFNIIWAENGVSTAPSNSKYQTGWIQEKPAYQYMNYVLNKMDITLAHINQTGFVEWDSVTEYIANKSYIRLANKVYFCKQTHTNQNPSTDVSETYWRPILDGTKVLADSAVSSFMKTVLDDTTGQLALQTMGVTSVGYNIATASSTSNAQTAMGGGATGKAVFIAANQAAAQSAIGLVDATESAAGKIEIASDAETNAGVVNNRAITPAKLRLGFAISLNTNGYIKFPSWLGSLTIRWGQEVVSTNDFVDLTSQFDTACFQVIAGLGVSGSTFDSQNPPFATPMGTGFRLTNPDDQDSSLVRYIAIGY